VPDYGAYSANRAKFARTLYKKTRILSVRQRTEPYFGVVKPAFCATRQHSPDHYLNREGSRIQIDSEQVSLINMMFVCQ